MSRQAAMAAVRALEACGDAALEQVAQLLDDEKAGVLYLELRARLDVPAFEPPF